MKKDKSRIFTYIAIGAMALQMYLPQLQTEWNLADISVKVLTSILLAIISIATIRKQRISVEVSNRAIILTWVLIAIAIIGCANEILSYTYLDNRVANLARSIIATILGLYNLVSKSIFPTEASKVIQETKNDIKTGTFGTGNKIDVPLNNT